MSERLMASFRGLRTGLALVVLVVCCGFGGSAAIADDRARVVTPLELEWRFHTAESPRFDPTPAIPTNAETVLLPHTWNAVDGDNGGGYRRGIGWYHSTLDLAADSDAVRPGRRVWLEFDGAALSTEVWVNDRHVGRHDGGYARFRFDITDAVVSGANRLVVRVDNSANLPVAPLSGDFTVFGGLYRPMRMITTSAAHFDLGDHGAPGIAMIPGEVTAEDAELTFVSRLSNDSERAFQGRLRVTLADADGGVVLDRTTRANVAAGVTVPVRQSATLGRPRLWAGRKDPHLYTLTATLSDAEGRVIDQESLRTGIRTVSVDPDRGMILNGEPVAVHGVNYFHAGRPGRGLAIQDAEIDADFDIMWEQGGTGIRFVHFQHPQRAYDQADRLGMVVWTEVPLNGKADPSPVFQDNLAQQMRELIRQNRHHPSVVVWGLGNEVYATDDPANDAIALMQKVAKEEDPTLPTAYAHCCQGDLDRKVLHADLSAYNRYFGWYGTEFAGITEWADKRRADAPDRPFSVSEYGAGASVLHQQNPPDRPTPDGWWHPEQYQTAYHEAYWRDLRDRPYLWGTFVWVGFDLASDGRDEGDRAGINDKGLVTYDRAVRKDGWYWYQANWSDRPMVHLLDRRLTDHASGTVQIKAYSNLESLNLSIDGVAQGAARVVDHVATWTVPLKAGLNGVTVTGQDAAGAAVADRMTWTGRPDTMQPALRTGPLVPPPVDALETPPTAPPGAPAKPVAGT